MSFRCLEIASAIREARMKLIMEANTKGVSENFGRSEIIRIKKDFIDPKSNTPKMQNRIVQLNEFIDWCNNYS